MMIPVRDLQMFLGVTQDGIIGPETISIINERLSAAKVQTTGWTDSRLVVGAEQILLRNWGYEGAIDGYEGPQTRDAWAKWVAGSRSPVSPPVPSLGSSVWPHQSEVMAFYGEVG